MHLIDYINTYEDWEERLAQPPYNLIIKTDGDYKLLKYSQLESDFSLDEVVEARGCIVEYDFLHNKWVYVCRPFKKFFNYGEPWAARIDWSAVKITEKIDGSLMKIWYDNKKWRLSTNGAINAFEASIESASGTYGDMFEFILGKSVHEFARDCYLYPFCTYLFEMTSPETRIVIPYDYGITYLTAFYNETGREVELTPFQEEQILSYVNMPDSYVFSSVGEVINAAKSRAGLHEGFVIRDKWGERVKIKTPAYLQAAHLFMKGNIGKADILRMMKDGIIDDFIGYFPEYIPMVGEIKFDVSMFCKRVEACWDLYGAAATRKSFAMKVKGLKESDALFRKYTDPSLDIKKYLWEEIRFGKLVHLLGYDEDQPCLVGGYNYVE